MVSARVRNFLVARGANLVDQLDGEMMAVVLPNVVEIGQLLEKANGCNACELVRSLRDAKEESHTSFYYRSVVEGRLAHIEQ